MPTVPDVDLVSSWEEVDAAAQAIKNGVQKSQMSAGVQSTLTKAESTMAVPRSSDMTARVGYDAASGRLFAEGMMLEQAKDTLLSMLEKQAYTVKNARALYNELAANLFPENEVLAISAVFTQGSTLVYDTDSLDELKPMLTVTAIYDDGSEAEVSAYTLSGALTVGTSTITATYRGKTATFDVTVVIGLDSICYGTKTYRDIFITDNLWAWCGDFENGFSISSEWTYKDSTHNSGYRIAPNSAASPSISSAQYNSPGHSLDVSASGSTKYLGGYIYTSDGIRFGVDYIVAFACKLSSYTSGKVEFQGFGSSSTVVRTNISANTNGWEPVVSIGSFVQGSTTSVSFNFGALSLDGNAPAFTGYIDDLVVTPKPSGMTLEQATTAMANFMIMVARGDS